MVESVKNHPLNKQKVYKGPMSSQAHPRKPHPNILLLADWALTQRSPAPPDLEIRKIQWQISVDFLSWWKLLGTLLFLDVCWRF